MGLFLIAASLEYIVTKWWSHGSNQVSLTLEFKLLSTSVTATLFPPRWCLAIAPHVPSTSKEQDGPGTCMGLAGDCTGTT